MESKKNSSSNILSFTLPEKHIYFDSLSFSLIIFLVIIGFVPAIFSLLRYGNVIPSASRAFIFLNFTALMVFLCYLFLKKDLKNTVCLFTEDSIIFKSIFTLKKIDFSEIEKISFFSFPLGKGFISIDSSREAIVLTLSLKNITSAIYRLEQLAIEYSIPLSNYNWNVLRQKAQVSEYYQKRASSFFPFLITTSMIMLPFDFFVGAVFWNMSIIPLMLWSLSGPLVPIVAYGVSDLIIRFKIDKQKKIIEDAEEKKISVWCGIMIFCLYLCFSILYNAMV